MPRPRGRLRQAAAKPPADRPDRGILDNFSRPLDRLEGEVVAALSELAVRIAGNLVGRAYEADPELLAALVHEALDSVRNVSARWKCACIRTTSRR
jgi:flagellar biosynthesis/type III secretory pathway protein FliH